MSYLQALSEAVPIILLIGLVVSKIIFARSLELASDYQLALITLCILPPPFIIPLFIKNTDQSEQAYIYNTLSLGAVVSVLIFIGLSVLYKQGLIF